MTQLVTLFLATFGLSYIVGRSKISLPVREALAALHRGPVDFLLELVECPACLGFWLGLAAALLGLTPVLTPWPALDVPAWGCVVCGAHYLLATATGWIHEEP